MKWNIPKRHLVKIKPMTLVASREKSDAIGFSFTGLPGELRQKIEEIYSKDVNLWSLDDYDTLQDMCSVSNL